MPERLNVWVSQVEESERLVSAAEVSALQTRLRQAAGGASRPAEPAGGEWSYQVYDWSRPVKLKHDQLRTLTSVHEAFCRLVGSSLGAYLRTPVTCDLVEGGVVPMSYAEYQEQALEGNLYHIVYAAPLPVPIIVELEVALGLAVLDRLLGGTGRGLARPHEITEMEQALLQDRVVVHVLEAFREAWSDIVDLTPVVSQTETNISFVPITLPSEAVVLVTTTLQVGDATGQLRLCLPYGALEPVKDRLSAQLLLSAGGMERPDDTAGEVRRQVGNVPLALVARLGEALVSLDDLLQLQIGDVIPLGTPIDGEIDVLVGGRVRYRGRPGLLRSHNAVRITRVIEEIEGEDENGRHHQP